MIETIVALSVSKLVNEGTNFVSIRRWRICNTNMSDLSIKLLTSRTSLPVDLSPSYPEANAFIVPVFEGRWDLIPNAMIVHLGVLEAISFREGKLVDG